MCCSRALMSLPDGSFATYYQNCEANKVRYINRSPIVVPKQKSKINLKQSLVYINKIDFSCLYDNKTKQCA